MNKIYSLFLLVIVLCLGCNSDDNGNSPVAPSLTQQNENHDYEFGAADFNGNSGYVYANYDPSTGIATFNGSQYGGEGTILQEGRYVLTSGGFIQAQQQMNGSGSISGQYNVAVDIGENGVALSYEPANQTSSFGCFLGVFTDSVICSSSYNVEGIYGFPVQNSGSTNVDDLTYYAYDPYGLFPVSNITNQGEAPLYTGDYVNDATNRFKIQSMYDVNTSTAQQMIGIYTNGNNYPTSPIGFFYSTPACN